MNKYCPKCKMNFSDTFDECPYCEEKLIVQDITLSETSELDILDMSDDEILCKYQDYLTEWVDNLSIIVKDYDEEVDYDEYFAFNGKDIYPTIFKDTNCAPDYPTVNFFIPQNAIIRKVKIKKVSDESIADGSMKYKTVKVIENITPDNPLCMIVCRGECVARYKISWKTLYGGKAEYYFHENSRSGIYNKSGIQYSYGIVSRIRKFFGLI